jgi:anhydro-N-acetylmuramic acid kinase
MSGHPIARLLGLQTKRVVGLMSGTSLDGVDAALVEVTGFGEHTRAKLVDFRMTPYTDAERALIRRSGSEQLQCEKNFALGERYAAAALEVMAGQAVDLIGSHGQTIWHAPPSSNPSLAASTLQIGEPAVIAARTGVVTVGDFRVADVALGGEGAPLVPWVDWVLFRQPGKVRALQNIGGIANTTVVGDRLDDVLAFDNGPGNMIADALAAWASNGQETCDRDGSLSARGKVLDDWLNQLLGDDYLKQKPPKSTGRERYGAVAEQMRQSGRDPFDLVATAVAFTAHAIARSYADFLPRVDEVLVSGGGAHNPTLMQTLAKLVAPTPVRAFAEGISPDAKEAVAFAVLAVQAIHAAPANVPRVTGARRPAVLGKICIP